MKALKSKVRLAVAWSVRGILLLVSPAYLLGRAIMPWLEALDIWAAEIVKSGRVS